MKIKARLELSKDLVKSIGLNECGKCQNYIDSFVFYHCKPYLPGKHIHTPHANDFGSGKVIWNTPDANYHYEGKLMVDPKTLKGAFFNPNYGFWSRPNTEKIMDPQNRDLNYHGNGRQGSHWFDRMIKSEMNELVKGVQHIVNGGK